MFLGHLVSFGQVWMDPKKEQTIWDWVTPSTVTELRSFLGLTNYYHRFIEGYNKKAAPLFDLLKKNRCWDWYSECQLAFDKLRGVVTSALVLKLPDFEKSFEVHTDASDKAVEGVIVHKGHPVAFESQKLSEAKHRYSTHEKEMAAIVHFLGVWRVYLLGLKFVVKMDNLANTFFLTQKKLSQWQARRQEFLAEYYFIWEHKLGRHNQVADALSMHEVFDGLIVIDHVESDMLDQLRQATMEDATYVKLVDLVRDGTLRRYWLDNGLLYEKKS